MNGNTASILVVDDDPAKRYGMTRMLKHHGFIVSEAVTGAEALAAAQALPDLIVLDVKLPDMSGFEVCRQLKQNALTARVLIMHMSATLVEAEHRVIGLEGGADAYLTDAAHPTEFLATVRALLRARDAERALRETEKRFEIMVRSVKEYAIYTCDAEGRITSWNAGVQRVFGYEREEFVGRNYGTVFASQAEAQSDLETARRNGHIEYDRWHERGDKTRFFATGSLTAIRDESAKIVGFVNIVRDVTERRQAEDERAELLAAERKARRDAERANRLKDEFLATLSHELRTPLTAILGWTQMLKLHRLPESQIDEGIAVIDRNAKAQAQLIEDLLDVSRIISGKLRLAVETVNIAALIGAAVESLQTAAQARQITIRCSGVKESATISGDPSRLQQIIWNLLSNAIKFTPPHGQISIELNRGDQELEVAVTDTGKGIAPEFLPHVFDRFRQADPSTTRSEAGLGLGLAIVRHLVELHGGTVEAESPGLGNGSTFRVRLPFAPPVPTQATAHRAAVRFLAHDDDYSEALPDLCGLSVLIVEDDPDGRDVLRRIIQQCGADVAVAASVAEAISHFRGCRPNVVISDIGMPGQDGYELIRQIRDHEGFRNDPVPAIALTAFAQSEDRQRALREGFQMHVSKPVVPGELLAVVESLCGRHIR